MDPTHEPIAPVSGTRVPRFAGASTFARLPSIDQVPDFDVAFLGVPFDSGTSYRPGARFGPLAIRTASRALRPAFHPDLQIAPFNVLQAVDAGDVAANPFSIEEAIQQIENHAAQLITDRTRLITMGGDHTVAFPLLQAAKRVHGPLAMIHFDAHLDTWDTYFGAPLTHGTVFRRAYEAGLLAPDHGSHIGIRGPLYDRSDLFDDARLGFQITRASDVGRLGVEEVAARIRQRVGDHAVYLSIDIDVLDPAFAPGTGTPEIGGLTSRELLELLRRLGDIDIVAADVVEVSPAYDHAEITALAAATIAFETCTLMAKNRPLTAVNASSTQTDHQPAANTRPG